MKITVEDLEFNKFINTTEGITVRTASVVAEVIPMPPYTIEDLEYRKFVNTDEGIAVRVTDTSIGGEGEPSYNSPWLNLPIINNSTEIIPIEINSGTEFIKVDMYTRRVSDQETRLGYQEFFLILNNGVWEWYENYYKGLITGWDGLNFSVATNSGLPELSYISNNMTGVYDDANSYMKYQVEEVR
jgi:hypothetical protein